MNEYATNGDASGQTPRIDELRYITWHSVGCTRLHPLDDKIHRCSSMNDSNREDAHLYMLLWRVEGVADMKKNSKQRRRCYLSLMCAYRLCVLSFGCYRDMMVKDVNRKL